MREDIKIEKLELGRIGIFVIVNKQQSDYTSNFIDQSEDG